MFLTNFFKFKLPVQKKNTANTIQKILNRIYRIQASQEILHKQASLEVSGEDTKEKMTKCIYRGQAYRCVSNQQKALKVSEFKTVEFIYRGQTYVRQIPVISYQSPRTNSVNWRFR